MEFKYVVHSYDDVASQIRPFDLIAFRGGDYASRIVQILEKEQLGMGEFSHVGLVVTSDILDMAVLDKAHDVVLQPNKLYIFESTYSLQSEVPDLVTGKGMVGIQLRDFEEIVTHYIKTDSERIAWCKLINNPYDFPANREKLKQIFTELFNRYHDTIYDISAIDLIASIISATRGLRDISDNITDKIFQALEWTHIIDNKRLKPSEWQFCSELVATIYQKIGVIPQEINAKNVIPMDFFGCDKDGLELLVRAPIYICKKQID